MRTNEYKVSMPRARGLVMTQVSDLHNRDFGGKLEQRIADINPDLIVVTGDMITRESKTAAALMFAQRAVKIAPVYYVSGNHEKATASFPLFSAELIRMGVRVLDNEYEVFSRGDAAFVLLGMSDPSFFAGGKAEFCEVLDERCDEIRAAYPDFPIILLTHRPELLSAYARSRVDLALSGHAHGGQVRIPFFGPLYAPGQGFMPKLTEGMHTHGDTRMIISRGLGSSNPVPRLFNYAELVKITLS